MKQIMGWLLALAMSQGAYPMNDSELQALVEQRLLGDRTGACMAVAVIEDRVSRAFVCAEPTRLESFDAGGSFEIGSISKTMTATLLADRVVAESIDLNDTLASHLPDGSTLPSFDGKPIRLRHLLDHSAGLPSLAPSWQLNDPNDPYRSLTAADVIGALAEVQLSAAPGSEFQYSNWGGMLLSWVVAQSADGDLHSLLRERLFEPLSMGNAYVGKAPTNSLAVAGHSPNQAQVSAWNFAPALAGVGGVRASLEDMIHYMQAQIGQRESEISAAIVLTQQATSEVDGQRLGMGWMLSAIHGQDVYLHEGGTGGFSAFAAFTADHQRAVVVLADTALTSLGGLGSLGGHLLDSRVPLAKPRIAQAAPAGLLAALVGDYELASGLGMRLRTDVDGLQIQASGQSAFRMGYDSAGDFYPVQFDAVLRPQQQPDGSYAFVWLQGGGAIPAQRIVIEADVAELSREQLAAYKGTYSLMPGLNLKVFVRRSSLYAQASGQSSFRLTARATDRFVALEHGIDMQFERDSAGRVSKLQYRQNGRSFEAERR